MTNIQNLFLKKENTIKDALKILDQAVEYHIVLIVDENHKLIGTITDGDIRRALLKNISLENSVVKIMSNNPVTLPEKSDKKLIKNTLIKKNLRQIILVDKELRVKDVLTIDYLSVSEKNTNKIFLMAGGLGSRLKPLTDNIPKPMLQVGGRPILQTIIERFVDEGFTDFFISVNYKKENIKEHFQDGSDFNCNITYIEEEKRMGTAGALSLLDKIPDEPIIIMNGDLLTRVKFKNLLDFHSINKASATMAIREYHFQVPFGVVDLEGSNILGISEKPEHKFFVNAGIYVLSPEAINKIPKGKFFDMPSLFDNLRLENHKTSGFPIREYWIDIGRKDELEKANDEYNSIFIKNKKLSLIK